MREQILSYAIKYHGEWKGIRRAIEKEEPWTPFPYTGNYVTILDQMYPQKLLRLQYPPWILFYQGNLALCEAYGVAVIGSRQAGVEGKALTHHVCTLLKERYVIISGLALGIDAAAHEAALSNATLAVIGCGLDVDYPKANHRLHQQLAQQQLVLSEYPEHTLPLACHFPWRNRLLAALSEAVIVIEAGMHSGTMLTVNEAITLDIPVYCLPHSFYDTSGKGGNFLISQGAGILVDEQDIREI